MKCLKTFFSITKVAPLELLNLEKIRHHYFNTPLSSLMDLTVSPKVKITKGELIGAHSLVCGTSRVEGCVGALKWD